MGLADKLARSFLAKEDKTLFEHEYVTVKETDSGYTYYEYGETVGLLPYRRNSDKPFLVRKEPVPSWGGGLFTWAVYGGIGDHGSVVQAALEELKEEAGYKVSRDDLVDVGKVNRGKNSTGVCYLFLVDVTDKKQGKIEGDGSQEEADSLVQWVDENYIAHSDCPILHSLLLKYIVR